jgi:hypothetical protein
MALANEIFNVSPISNCRECIGRCSWCCYSVEFNAKLKGMLPEQFWSLIIDLNPNSILDSDYSQIIIANPVLFEDVGYKVAISVLELFYINREVKYKSSSNGYL